MRNARHSQKEQGPVETQGREKEKSKEGSALARTETPGTSLSGGGDIAQQLRPAAMGQKKAN